ncbi:MAG: response regulator [Bacteroidota bacterium]
MKFRNKILLAIWGMVLVLLMITFVLVNYWMRAQIESRFSDDIQGNYSTVREISSLRAEEDIKSCQIIAESPRLMAVSELGDKNTALQLSRELNSSIKSDLFILTNSKGTPLVQLISGNELKAPVPTFESIRRALTMEPTSDVWEVNGNVYRGASAPVVVGTDIVGTLTIGFRVRDEDIDAVRSMTNSDILLAVDEGVVSATIKGSEMSGVARWLQQSGQPFIPHEISSKAEVFSIDGSGEKYVAAFCRLNRDGFPAISYILLKPTERAVKASLAPVTSAFLVLSVLVLIVTAVIGLIISNGITKPIASLVQGTAEISKGNYDYRIDIHSGGELKFLAQKFEEMSGSLKEKINQLAERNAELEDTLRRLGETEGRLQTILDTSAAIIYVKDLEGKYLLINRRFETLYHCKREEVIGKTDHVLFAKEIADAFRLSDRKALEAGAPVEWEEVGPHDDGMHTYIANKFPLFGAKGVPYAVCGFLTDITDRKKLEEGLRQAQKMESIGTLAGGIAHDFNNILGIILGYVSRLESGKLTPDKLSASFEALRKASHRGADLVRQILTFARKTDVLLESVNLNAAITELVKMLSETFPKTVLFSLNLERHLPSIVADAGQVQQLLLNLCVNARDAMIDGGALTITTRIVEGNTLMMKFPEAENKPYACIDVEDTGTGMDDATRARIFEPFFTTKELGHGTGLGLSVVFGIINSHHGFIDVESALGHGTTFHLYFPVPPGFKESDKKENKQFEFVKGGTETILLVEDEEILRDLVKNTLEEKGYAVITAQDGIEAVNLFTQQKDRIALVLCDMGLPKLGGWDAFKIMKEIRPKLKIIFASGYLEPGLKAEILKGGARVFVQKPYDPDEIIKQIREVIDRNES